MEGQGNCGAGHIVTKDVEKAEALNTFFDFSGKFCPWASPFLTLAAVSAEVKHYLQ